jgi:PAS domain S-box-containing protein
VGRVPAFWKLSAAALIIILVVLWASGSMRHLMSAGLTHVAFVIALSCALSCVFAWAIQKVLIRKPLGGLVVGMNKLAEKEFDFRLHEDERDEYRSVASSFNDMASMLSASLRELKKNQDYLNSVLESSADIIITVTPTAKIQTINRGAEDALGYSRSEVIGKPIQMFFADPHQREAAIEKLEYSDNVRNIETQFVAKDGSILDVLLTISRLRNASGQIIGTIGISKDITEEKRLQKQLIQSQRLAAIGQAFTGIQHGIKNMLNACKGGAYMVRTGLATDNRKMLEEGWEMVQEGISRMTKMSMDMLQYVKEWSPKSERTDMSEMLKDIHLIVKKTATDKGVNLDLDIPAELPSIACDSKMIHAVVMDVVSNALDACLSKDYRADEKPQIMMTAYPTDDRQQLVIEIKDNGCGMSASVKENIFTPFFSTKSSEGTGLGLSLTSRAVNVHGGTIDVESEPDHGATFRIVLPVDGTLKDKEQIDAEEGPRH